MNESICANCDAVLEGEYCAACGQRRFRPRDRRMAHLLGESFDALTDFDGRIWRSLRAALLQPGRIARDWIEGRRARWIAPGRLFLLATLLCFLAPGLTDLSLPFNDQVRGQVYQAFDPAVCADPATSGKCRGGQHHSAYTESLLVRRLQRERAAVEARGGRFTLGPFEQRYNAQSEAIGKLLVILHVPFIALALALVAWRSRRYYAEHFVVALGMTTFALLFVQLLLKPAEWLYTRVHGWLGTSGEMPAVVPLLLLAIFVGHFAAACRRCYDGGWWRALVQGIAAFVAFAAASMWVYRPAQFLLALWTM